MTEPHQSGSDPASGERRLRVARWVVLASTGSVVLFFPATAALGIAALWDTPSPKWALWLGLVLSIGLVPLGLRMFAVRLGYGHRYSRGELWLSLALLLGACACFDFTFSSALLTGLWWACAFLVTSRPERLVATAIIVVPATARALSFPTERLPEVLGLSAYAVGVALVFTLANTSVLFLWDIAREAHNARDAQARLAVTQERLRFSRDMHDLLGHSLSGIAVKSELAARLAERDAGRAAGEMLAVQAMAREALREVRSAISGYRDVELGEEIANVEAVLTATGIRCSITGADLELPTAARTTAAWVVREGATNILRHSTARHCDITIRLDGTTALIEVYNDGAAHTAEQPSYGNGLTGLTERVTSAGGTLSAGPSGKDGFLLRVLLPLPRDEDQHRVVRTEEGVSA